MPDQEDPYGSMLIGSDKEASLVDCFRDRQPCSRHRCAAWCFDASGDGYCSLVAAAESQAAYYGRMTQIIDQAAAGAPGAPPLAG